MGYKGKKWKKEEKRDKNEQLLTIKLNLTYKDVENITKLLLSSNQEKIEKINK